MRICNNNSGKGNGGTVRLNDLSVSSFQLSPLYCSSLHRMAWNRPKRENKSWRGQLSVERKVTPNIPGYGSSVIKSDWWWSMMSSYLRLRQTVIWAVPECFAELLLFPWRITLGHRLLDTFNRTIHWIKTSSWITFTEIDDLWIWTSAYSMYFKSINHTSINCGNKLHKNQ